MSKVVYVIPGLHGSVKMMRYQRIIRIFKKCGFKVVPIAINWDRRVMSDYIAEFLEQINHSKNDKVYLFGFSLGAMLAFIVAEKIKPGVLILGSLSPFFKEDLKFIKKSWKNYLGKNRLEDFKKFSFSETIKRNTKYKTYLLVGEKEDKILLQKAKVTHQKIGNSKMIIIEGVNHNVKDTEYLRRVEKVIHGL